MTFKRILYIISGVVIAISATAAVKNRARNVRSLTEGKTTKRLEKVSK